jgi:hypothetical protein
MKKLRTLVLMLGVVLLCAGCTKPKDEKKAGELTAQDNNITAGDSDPGGTIADSGNINSDTGSIRIFSEIAGMVMVDGIGTVQ